MATLTSECDFNTFVGQEMQYHLSHYFSSLTTDMNRDSQNPLVPEAHGGKLKSGQSVYVPGVRVHVFCFSLFVNSLSSPVNGYSGGR